MNETKSCPCEHVLRLQEKVEEQQKDIGKLFTHSGKVDIKLDTIKESQERMEKKLDALTSKPAKRWESLVTEVIKVLVAAVIGFALAHIGLK